MEQIWILGSSLIFWLSEHLVKTRQSLTNQFTATIHGRSGAKWHQLRTLINLFTGPRPKFLIIHLSGNNIGPTCTPLKTLMDTIKTDLTNLSRQYSSTRRVWSEILPRRYWSEARGKQSKMEGLRRRINRTIRKHMTDINGLTIRHDNITYNDRQYFKRDGTHMTSAGNQRLADNIRNFINENK